MLVYRGIPNLFYRPYEFISRAVVSRSSVANMSKLDDRKRAQEEQYIYNKEKDLIKKLKDLLDKRESELEKLKSTGSNENNIENNNAGTMTSKKK